MLLQLKIKLANISKPPVWRRVLVPQGYSFQKLHKVIQAAFGWQNYHLYMFSPQGYGSYPSISIPSTDDWYEVTDSKKIKLSEIFGSIGQKFTYIYDFGDDWVHKIIVEKMVDATSTHATLLAGKGACPPEDCGGPWGYLNLQEILKTPRHAERKGMLEWLDMDANKTWDAHFFDFEKAKKKVDRL